MRLHYKVRENEAVQYVDVMSLYPYICKYLKFPIGHPRIHVGDACKDVEACLRMDGLIMCTIVPLQKLYHPVIPYRCNKLMFCLCRTCVQTCAMNAYRGCGADPDGYMGNGRGAVGRAKGVPNTRNVRGLRISGHAMQPRNWRGWAFRRLHKHHLKLKAEASGFPGWVRSPEDEEQYVESFWKNEGIRIDRESIRTNAANLVWPNSASTPCGGS